MAGAGAAEVGENGHDACRRKTYVLCRTAPPGEREGDSQSFSARIERRSIDSPNVREEAQRPQQDRATDRKDQARHPQVADARWMLRKPAGASWKLVKDCQAWQQLRRRTCRGPICRLGAPNGWSQYIQRRSEAAFRVLKSELLIRPLFH
jgi:hypothetical protein